MIFLEKICDWIVITVGSTIGSTVGTVQVDIGRAVLNYILYDVDNGYFKYHPEDTDRTNSISNLMKRAVTLAKDIKSGVFGLKPDTMPC